MDKFTQQQKVVDTIQALAFVGIALIIISTDIEPVMVSVLIAIAFAIGLFGVVVWWEGIIYLTVLVLNQYFSSPLMGGDPAKVNVLVTILVFVCALINSGPVLVIILRFLERLTDARLKAAAYKNIGETMVKQQQAKQGQSDGGGE